MISNLQMLITWVHYAITAKDKKDESTPARKKSILYRNRKRKAATLITFAAKSGFSQGAAYFRTPRAMLLMPHKFTHALVK
jgi:hypothetical protein